jgi:hypothetical protein
MRGVTVLMGSAKHVGWISVNVLKACRSVVITNGGHVKDRSFLERKTVMD